MTTEARILEATRRLNEVTSKTPHSPHRGVSELAAGFSPSETVSLESLICSIRDRDTRSSQGKISILESAKEIVRQLESPDGRAMELLMSFSIVPTLKIAMDMGVFKMLAIRSRITASEIAHQAKAEEEFVVRIMRVLVSIGVVTILSVRTYGSTRLSDFFTVPANAAGICVVNDQALRAVSRFSEYAAAHSYHNPTNTLTGPFQFALNTFESWFSWLSTRPHEAANFNLFMTGFRNSKPAWPMQFPAESIIFSGIPSSQDSSVTVVDVGGGFGHDLSLFAEKSTRKPGRLVCQDQESVIATVPSELAVGIEFVAHDFFREQPVRGARAYLLKHICHDWPHALALSILKNIKVAMEPGYSKMLIMDLVMPEGKVPLAAAGLDVAMMTGFSGTEREEKLWMELVEDAGLSVRKIWKGQDGDGLLEVVLEEDKDDITTKPRLAIAG